MKKLMLNGNEKILVVAPHQDDETIGCGGLLSLYGSQIDVLFVTNGCKGHGDSMSDEECTAIRNQEAEQAMKLVNVHSVQYLNIPDSNSAFFHKEIRRFDVRQYDYIFIPNRLESHKDHRSVNEVFRKMVHRQKRNICLVEYEVWTPLVFPNVYLDISDTFSVKEEMINCYKSQLKIHDYYAIAKGLSMYRGSKVYTQFAEMYEIIDKKKVIYKIFYRFPIRMQKRLKKFMKGAD